MRERLMLLTATHSDRIQTPFGCLLAQTAPFHMPWQWHHPLCDNVDVVVCLCSPSAPTARAYNTLSKKTRSTQTSIVSSTLTTPGCLNVRSLRTAFLARGNRDLFADTSKVNMLQGEPSSWDNKYGLVSFKALYRLDTLPHTRLVPLWRVQFESPRSTRSPKL